MQKTEQQQCPIIADDQRSGCKKLVDGHCYCPTHGDVWDALGRLYDTGYGTIESYHKAEMQRRHNTN